MPATASGRSSCCKRPMRWRRRSRIRRSSLASPWRPTCRAAAAIYEQILARDPASRPAMLGLARVARSQNRLDEARALYAAPAGGQPEGSRGAERDGLAGAGRAQPRSGARRLRARARRSSRTTRKRRSACRRPGRLPLSARRQRRGGLDATGHVVGLRRAGMAGITAVRHAGAGLAALSPTSCRRVSATGLATLPSHDITVGYHRLVPLSYAVSLVYDYRGSRQPAHRALDRRQRRHLSHRLAALVRRLSPVLRRPPVRWPPDPDGLSATARALLGGDRHGLQFAAGRLRQLSGPVERGGRRHLLRAAQHCCSSPASATAR